MKAKQQSSLRRVLCPRTLITLSIIVLLSCSQKALAQQWNTNGNNISNANSGNVGVGTTTPQTKLDIASQAATNDGITISQYLDQGGQPSIFFRRARGSFAAPTAIDPAGRVLGDIFFQGYDGSAFNTGAVIESRSVGAFTATDRSSTLRFFTTLNTTLTERMRIDQNGNIGIGTPNPLDLLHLYGTANSVGTIRIQGGNTYAGYVGMWDGGPSLLLSNNRHPGTGANFNTGTAGALITLGTLSTPSDMMFSTTSNGMNGMTLELMRIKGSGSVGIGTATPSYKLDVQGGQINSSGGLCIAGDCKTAWSQVGGGSSQWTTSGSNVYFNTGNVGIGTTNPGVRLAVNGNGLNVYNTDAWIENNMHVQGNETLAQGGRGRLRIGTAWGYMGLYSEVSSTGVQNDLVLGAGTGNVRVGPGAASAQNFLVPNGNVGIGTATPGTRLTVQGPVPSGTTDIFRVLPGATFNNGSLFTVSSLDTAGGARAGTRVSISGDNAGNGGSLVLDWFNPASGNRGVLAGPNGLSFYTNAALTGGSPRAFTFRSVDLSAFGAPNAVVSVQNAAGADLFLVQQGGNVGVGTAGPGFKLDVQNGQINSSGGLCIAGDCKTAWSEVGGGSSQWTTAGSTIHYNTGNVGVGTASPVFDANTGKFFTVDGGAGSIGSIGAAGGTGNLGTAVGQVAFVNSSLVTIEKRLATIVGATDTGANSGLIDFYTASGGAFSAPRMRINSSGNVGIGTTSPANKLHVAGGTRVDGGNGRIYLGAGAVNGARGFEIIEENATTFSLRHHDPNVAWQNIVINPHGGNVGIGTLSPTTKLHVAGDGKVTGNLTVDGNIAAKYQDVAEWVPATRALAPGTVVTLNQNQSNLVEASSKAYDTSVAGVISAQPGIALGESGENKLLVATTGRVRIKVDATKAPIQIGDLLVTSDLEGFAMKSLAVNIGGIWIHRPGTIIGKALEPLASGRGEILVLLSLQ